jgi:hypothetical protein
MPVFGSVLMVVIAAWPVPVSANWESLIRKVLLVVMNARWYCSPAELENVTLAR